MAAMRTGGSAASAPAGDSPKHCVQEGRIGECAPESHVNVDSAGGDWVASVLWSLGADAFFFASGHQAAFPTIQWVAAFVGFTNMYFYVACMYKRADACALLLS